MNEPNGSREQLLAKIAELRRQIDALKALDSSHKETPQGLSDRERQLRSLFAQAAVGIAVVDANGRFLDCNRTWCQMLGYEREELLKLALPDVTAAGEPVLLPGDNLNGAHYVRVEKQYLRKSGSQFWGDLCATVISDREGNVEGMLGVIIDITERKEAEHQLRFQAQLLDSVRESVIATDLDGTVIYWGKGAEALYGYAAEETLGRPITFIVESGQEQAEWARIHQVRESGSWTGRYVQRRKDGALFWAETTISLVTGQDGKPFGMIGIDRDITEKVHAEKTLQRRNHSLSLLNRVSQILIATLDLGQVLEQLLRAAVEITGAEGSSVWLWDEERAGDLVCRAILLDGEFVRPDDLRLRSGQGVAGWVAQRGRSSSVSSTQKDSRFYPGIDDQIGFKTSSLLAVPLKMRDHVSGVLEVVNKHTRDIEGVIKDKASATFDIEDQLMVEMLGASAAIAIDNARLIEALRKYGMELETRNQDLDAFAHSVAHDLKNPLGHMVGYAELLEQSEDTLSEQERHHCLRTIARTGRKMSNIIDELLLFAGVRTKDRVTTSPLDMAVLIQEAEKRLADMIQEYEAEIRIPGTWPRALGYGPWVEEVWVNYLSNAIQYGGRPPRVELGATEQSNGTVRFWVRDNGVGLTPEEQARLFTSFERLDRVRAKGHGLGLSIVNRIVEKLNGEVAVSSRVGEGSVFSFTLPAVPR
jgi:PAS domain S-box-containing protein